ncbi:MAG: alpha-ribazole phosphatase [Candidatus Omnitrophica bacterium]|nr:alpha-ribazole phosphatase [Candidatus Omnitrophota bacterium]
MGRIYLIRHAETDYNKFRRYAGKSDVPLNRTGRRQARSLSGVLRDERFDAIFSSPLRRARDTARFIAGRKKIIIEPDLREIDFGLWEGLRFEQIKKMFPREISLWLNRPLHTGIPGGESYSALKKRVMVFFNKVASGAADKTIAIVTHHGPIKAIIYETLRLNEDDFWNISIDSASVICVCQN